MKRIEIRDKVSKANLGREFNPEWRVKLSRAKMGIPNLKLRGRRLSEETRQKLRESNLGHPSRGGGSSGYISPEHYDLLSETLKDYGDLKIIEIEKNRPDAIVIDWDNKIVRAIEIELSNPWAKRTKYERNDLYGFDEVRIKGKSKYTKGRLIEFNLKKE